MSTSAISINNNEYLFPKEDFDPVIASEALADAIQFIKDEWEFSNEQIGSIIKVSKNTIKNWLDDESVPVSKKTISAEVEALVSLLSIHKSLHAMFSTADKQLEWLTTKHPLLEEKPLVLMEQSHENLFAVRQYLDYVRGRGA